MMLYYSPLVNGVQKLGCFGEHSVPNTTITENRMLSSTIVTPNQFFPWDPVL